MIAGSGDVKGHDTCAISLAFELPTTIRVPGDHRHIEALAADGQHEGAALALGALRAAAVIDGERAALAEATCWTHAGYPERAVAVLGSRARTPESAWCLACSLVRLRRLDEAAREVISLGQRVPLLGPRRRAARALLLCRGMPLPPWLVDHAPRRRPVRSSRGPVPSPHLASFFVPALPEVPPGFEDVAEIILRGGYEKAAIELTDRPVETSRVGIQVAVAVAECWLLADEPAVAEAWLRHRLPARGIWALACAHVQQNRLEEALGPLSALARRHRLGHEWQDATAALLAHLELASLPADLDFLAGHPLLDRRVAEQDGYRRFAQNVAREVARQNDSGSVERVIRRIEARCENVHPDQARPVLLTAYEAAARTVHAPRAVAHRGLDLLLSRPELLGADESQYSMALLFAMTGDRLDDLRRLLGHLADQGTDRQARFECRLAAAKLSLVQDDVDGVLTNAVRASQIVPYGPSYLRAARLRRAARWLTPDDRPRVSEWRLRRLHHNLPLAVAQRLDDRDREFESWLRVVSSTSAQARRLVDSASRHLEVAVRLDEAPIGDLPRLRHALGSWSLLIGQALLEASRRWVEEAVAFTAAAWTLLGPDVPAQVAEAHARAVGLACAGLPQPSHVLAVLERAVAAIPSLPYRRRQFDQDVVDSWAVWRRSLRIDGFLPIPPDLARILQPVSREAVPAPGEAALSALGGLDDVAPEVREAIVRCLVDRLEILPAAPPFRGRRWFQSDAAHSHYQRGRMATDARAAHKAFEEAWVREPNAYVTTHGLILGLGRRLREKRGRGHLLDRLARVLDQVAEREVEAALAYSTLAELAESDPERHAHLERAVAALRRRARRSPWTRARNAEIGIELELGNLLAAGDAAWEESCQHLPGSPGSKRYALLAAALWRRVPGSEQALEAQIEEAERRARLPRLTNRGAVQYAVEAGSLVLLTDLPLDEEALDELWTACRGNEDELCRFLEKQGTRAVNPRHGYLRFMAERLRVTDPAASARIRHRFLQPDLAPVPPRLAWLRLAAAELLVRDPLHEVPTPRNRLRESHVRDLLACLRASARQDDVAYTAFDAAVEDALGALFDLRERVLMAGQEPYSEQLAGASAAISAVGWAARRFGTPELARIAGLVSQYLAMALDPPAVESYLLEKEKRLVPSRVGMELGTWWDRLSRSAGSLDFFHLHQQYRLVEGTSADAWWRQRVHGQPMREALVHLSGSLETHARQLAAIEDRYARHAMRGPGRAGFGLLAEFDACLGILRSALAAGADIGALGAIEGALERLGTVLRAIDLSRLLDTAPDVVYDNAVPVGRYLLPRALELLGHWRRNVRGAPHLQAAFEVRDDSGREVLCLMTLDRECRPVPDSTPLRGLAQFADLVEALGGQLHLWVARPGQRRGCRREHGDGLACTADDYALRVEDRLRHLAITRWHDQRPAIQQWLDVLDGALRSAESATLAFALLPRLFE